jgi:hypothetical protein
LLNPDASILTDRQSLGWAFCRSSKTLAGSFMIQILGDRTGIDGLVRHFQASFNA